MIFVGSKRVFLLWRRIDCDHSTRLSSDQVTPGLEASYRIFSDELNVNAGRFDLITFVGTPNIASRVRRLTEKLQGMPSSPLQVVAATTLFEDLLKQNWSSWRFLTFAENEVLINFIAEFVSPWEILKSLDC